METRCEVIGWVFVDAEKPQLLVREDNGLAPPLPVNFDNGFSHQAIQTGSFRRGNPIVDPQTKQTVGYEMERMFTPYLAS